MPEERCSAFLLCPAVPRRACRRQRKASNAGGGWTAREPRAGAQVLEERYYASIVRIRELETRHDRAIESGNMLGMLTSLRSGLDSLPRHIAAWVAVQDSSHVLSPTRFLEPRSYALAALAGDEGLLLQMDDIYRNHLPGFDADATPTFLTVAGAVKDILQAEGSSEKYALRRRFPRAHWRYLADILNVGVRTGTIFLTTIAGKSEYSLTQPEAPKDPAPAKAPTLGPGLVASAVSLLDVRYVSIQGVERDPFERFEMDPFEERHTDPGKHVLHERRAFSPICLVFAETTWLTTVERESGGTEYAIVEVLDRGGVVLSQRRIRLPKRGLQFHKSLSDSLVMMDEHLNVTVLTQYGDVASYYSLWSNVDFRAAFKTLTADTKRDRAILDASASVLHDLLVFTVSNRVFVYRLNGERVAVFRLPQAPMPHMSRLLRELSPERQVAWESRRAEVLRSAGLPPEASRRQAMSALDADVPTRHEGSDSFARVTRSLDSENYVPYEPPLDLNLAALDEARFARPTRDGAGVWISGKSGLLLRVNLSSLIEEAWVLPSQPDQLVEAEWGTWGMQGTGIFFLRDGEPPHFYAIDGVRPATISQNRLVSSRGKVVKVFDLVNRVQTMVEIPGRHILSCEIDSVAVVDTTSTRYSIG